MGKRVLVTGGGGFIGTHLVSALISAGWEVRILDSTPVPVSRPLHAEWIEGDVRDPDLVDTSAADVDLVFHLASLVGVSSYMRSPIDVIEVAVSGTANVLAASRRTSARVVVASTSEVFGANPNLPWDEDAYRVLGPSSRSRWSYGSAKGTAEHLCHAWHRDRGLPVTIVRPFNVYGAHQRPDFLLPRAVHNVLNGLAVPIHDGGDQTRCFTEVSDVVGGFLAAATVPEAIGSTFNLGHTEETSVLEAVRVVAEVAQVPLDIEEVDARLAFGPGYQDIRRRVPSTGRARALLDWEPTVDLRDGVRRLVHWARNHPDWLAPDGPPRRRTA